MVYRLMFVSNHLALEKKMTLQGLVWIIHHSLVHGNHASLLGVKYDKAVAKLVKDREALLTFYDYPAEHWKHIRTSNPIESTFATVRHRTKRTKGCLSRRTGLAMAFKLMMSAQGKWRKLDGQNRLPEIIQGIEFRDGLRQLQAAA